METDEAIRAHERAIFKKGLIPSFFFSAFLVLLPVLLFLHFDTFDVSGAAVGGGLCVVFLTLLLAQSHVWHDRDMRARRKRRAAAARFIHDLDLSRVRAKLLEREDWDDARVDAALGEYRQFLFIRALTEWSTKLVPLSEDMDEVWHEHILFSRQYQHMCSALFGNFLHHNPEGGSHSRSRSTAYALRHHCSRQEYDDEDDLLFTWLLIDAATLDVDYPYLDFSEDSYSSCDDGCGGCGGCGD